MTVRTVFAKSRLNLDWVERTDTLSGREWVCVTARYDLTVRETKDTISAQVGVKEQQGFDTVYDAMKWAESMWFSQKQ